MEFVVTSSEVKDFLFEQIRKCILPEELSNPEFVTMIKENLFQKFFKSVKLNNNCHTYFQYDVEKFIEEQLWD
jgi:hypothetical protein